MTRPGERAVVSLASLGASVAAPFLRRPTGAPPRDVLVLRLDRIGDVLMSLPALRALRKALPDARIRLAVGEWSREIAHEAPVDEVLVWNAPWVGRKEEGAHGLSDLVNRARRLGHPPDLALDLQGDLRAIWLMAATGARDRVGYANTGSEALLTRVVSLDEDLNFVEQNHRAVERALGGTVPRDPFRWLDESSRDRGRERLAAFLRDAGMTRRGPVIGLHPGAGRKIKEWPLDRFAELAARLTRENGAIIVVTGSGSEAFKAEPIRIAAPEATVVLSGRLGLLEFAETMSGFDAFVSGDTSAMHFACALGLPTVSIFGPSDPGRYFSGGPSGFNAGGTQIALAPKLWCAPCNLIRRPPEECDALPAPECLQRISVDDVIDAVRRVLPGATRGVEDKA